MDEREEKDMRGRYYRKGCCEINKGKMMREMKEGVMLRGMQDIRRNKCSMNRSVMHMGRTSSWCTPPRLSAHSSLGGKIGQIKGREAHAGVTAEHTGDLRGPAKGGVRGGLLRRGRERRMTEGEGCCSGGVGHSL